MADIPYSMRPNGIPEFLNHIRTAGIPDKVTQTYLESSGFKAKNDRGLIKIMKHIGFLDSTGKPTDDWRAYRGEDGKAVLGRGIKDGYSELFHHYPDANRRDDEALRNWIRANSSLSEDLAGRAVKTFRQLSNLADFDAKVSDESSNSNTTPAGVSCDQASAAKPKTTTVVQAPSAVPTININIQLQLPDSDDGKVYDKFFEAMRKNLIDGLQEAD